MASNNDSPGVATFRDYVPPVDETDPAPAPDSASAVPVKPVVATAAAKPAVDKKEI